MPANIKKAKGKRTSATFGEKEDKKKGKLGQGSCLTALYDNMKLRLSSSLGTRQAVAWLGARERLLIYASHVCGTEYVFFFSYEFRRRRGSLGQRVPWRKVFSSASIKNPLCKHFTRDDASTRPGKSWHIYSETEFSLAPTRCMV